MAYPLDQAEATTPATLAHRRWLPWVPIALGLVILYGPTLYDLFSTVWKSDEQGHGPIVLAIAIWLIWRRKDELFDGPSGTSRPLLGLLCIVVAAAFYFLGRTQDYLFFEAGSLVFMLAGAVLLMRGVTALKSIWFALFFMLFMVPLPNSVVDLFTQPMKMAVSYVAESVLFAAGYPIARSGVMLLIGPYQLLVADACAGLHTLFTLEALGLLYLNVVRHASAVRNVVLAILIVPISFIANVIRVMTLTLITYYLGDEAGQGFLHGFAGMVLFMSALMLIIAADSAVRVGVRTSKT
ncbi:exosortase B [Pelomonas aquatica]|uniref:Exosortase B n=1 Tax=Pelomonas aquatica TaxID=431058 RepID=A0ABU1Z6Y5_9BURK|nr:exosortase B [Pelomonas aquatica]MDR7295740.1 exosortase B [Pelomonas aquatica]